MSTMIPYGSFLKLLAINITFNPAAVATITTAEQSVTVPGVKVGDIVISVNKPSLTAGVGIANARVSAADTVALTFVNPTAGSVDPGSEVYTFVIGRPESVLASFSA